MRAFACPVILSALSIVATPGAAQPVLQADALAASVQLVQAARGEAQRLGQLAGDSKATPSNAESRKTSPEKPAKIAGKKSLRHEQLHAKLLESERVRIRDKYRELQQRLIAARRSNRLNSANLDAAITGAAD